MTCIFVFRPKMNVHFRFRFVFGRKWNFIFVGIFVYGRKWKMLFGRPLVYIIKEKVLVLVLRCKVLVLVLNTRLGLGLGLERILKSWSWSWSWKKVLITSLVYGLATVWSAPTMCCWNVVHLWIRCCCNSSRLRSLFTFNTQCNVD